MLLNKRPIIICRGKKNRVYVIFDDLENITKSHLKSFHLRLYLLFSTDKDHFRGMVIFTKDITESKNIETLLHNQFGENSGYPKYDFFKLFDFNFRENEMAKVYLKMAYFSLYSGINYLEKRRREN